MNPIDASVSRAFNQAYYDSHVWAETKWLGVQVLKSPTDLWSYQEILAEIQPDIIIETGTHAGGSALFLASVCDLLGCGRIISIDIIPRTDLPAHERITYLVGSSTDPALVETVTSLSTDQKCLVILDSDHSQGHVACEMDTYAPLVSIGSYLIVEDTNINGHPVLDGYGPGPMEAVEDFLRGRSDFAPDECRERFALTFNPKGYLRRHR